MSRRDKGRDDDAPTDESTGQPDTADAPRDAAEREAPEPRRPRVPLRTTSIDGTNTGPWHDDPNLVTRLQQYNRDVDYEFPRDRDSLMIGSGTSCDIIISNREAGLSGEHCRLRRRGSRIEVVDQASRNGTYLDNSRESYFSVGAGDTWVVAKTTTLLAMTDEMHTSRPTFIEILGVNAKTSADDLLIAAIGGTNILITGESSCNLDQLVTGIHRISKRRGSRCEIVRSLPTTTAEQRALIDRASRATLVLNLFPEKKDQDSESDFPEQPFADGAPPVGDDAKKPPAPKKRKEAKQEIVQADRTFVSMLLSSDFNLRLIVMAPARSDAVDLLGGDAIPPFHLAVTPLRFRSGEILSLLDRALARIGSSLRMSDLTQESQNALEAYSWPKNHEQIHNAARLLDMRARNVKFEDAAAILGLPHSTLHRWFTNERALGLNPKAWLVSQNYGR